MSTDINIFELASRQKTRFETIRGNISSEQLWDLPLTSKSGIDLDTIGQVVVAQLESTTTRSLVNAAPHPREADLNLQLALIKHVIAYKQEANAAALAKSKKTEERNRLIELLGKKQDAALEQLSEAEIKAKLAALDD
jgi:hypothetical protein